MTATRRRALWLGAAGLTAAALARQGRTQPARPFDLSGYRQTFAAEFDDPAAPLTVARGGPFTTRFEQWGGLRTLTGTGEQELYVDAAFVPAPGGTDKEGHADAPDAQGKPLGYDPFAVRNGCLEISAIPVPAELRGRVDRAYLSGLISTEWSFTQRFGYFEMRAQLPPGRGLWPAFWMVSKTAAEHIEIDAFEAIGEPGRIYHSIHMSKALQPLLHVASAAPRGETDGMHTYGVSWTADAVVFYVDGVEHARADGAPLRDAPPMYLLANLAVGGNWPGAPPAATHFPAVMRIDYIRAYQKG